MTKSTNSHAAGIYSALTPLFARIFRRHALTLTPDLSAKDVPGWDSFKQIEIITAVEAHYGITLTTKELDSLHNVGDLVRVIQNHGAGGGEKSKESPSFGE